MTKYLLGVLCLAATVPATATNCDLTDFRWMCKLPIQARPSHHAPSVIDCNGRNVFVSHAQYNEIMRYQRANVNMVLKVNGEYISSPCVPKAF